MSLSFPQSDGFGILKTAPSRSRLGRISTLQIGDSKLSGSFTTGYPNKVGVALGMLSAFFSWDLYSLPVQVQWAISF